ncbi:MAG: FAD-binding oxidoreductase [Saprospiraceae bacterium]|nr:FAD-binding oxidoreductase [Saprospiraceae bacterium]
MGPVPKSKKKLSGWANFPAIEADVFEPQDAAGVGYVVKHTSSIIARGNGKSYGDASLSPVVLSTLGLNRILHFDPDKGLITCEAGVLLADILPVILSAGWFFHVTPGIKSITVGGAIASDVHGKNHPAKGCFSNWLISVELMIGDGSIVLCSRDENPDLFWQTCGGMGWTGVIISATFQLMRIQSSVMRQQTVHGANLEQLFAAFEENNDAGYAAAWIDTTAGLKNFGRGAVHFAEHDSAPSSLIWPETKTKNIRFFAPSWILNPLSIRAHNAIYFNKNKPGVKYVHMDDYFYPLDRITNWNRLYGRRGFVQYQFCIPEEKAFDGFKSVLEAIRKSADTPFLSVMKRHGERPPEAIHSFPIKGYSLALDFPRTRTILSLVEILDDIVWQFDGKIYLTKDACSNAKMGRVDPGSFGEPKFWSLLKGRIG